MKPSALRALRDGYSAAITADLAKLEQQLAAARERLKASDPQAVKLQLRDTRRFVECRLRDLRALWDGEPRIAREEIAKHRQNHSETNASHVYRYWRTRWGGCYGGAGGPVRTVRPYSFSLSLAA